MLPETFGIWSATGSTWVKNAICKDKACLHRCISPHLKLLWWKPLGCLDERMRRGYKLNFSISNRLHRQGLNVFLHLTLAPFLGNKIWNALKLKTLLSLEKNTRSPHGLHMVCPHLIATARWYHLAQLRTFRACTISSRSGGIIQNWTEEGLPLPRSHLEPPCYAVLPKDGLCGRLAKLPDMWIYGVRTVRMEEGENVG